MSADVLPILILHADWSTNAKKRWIAIGRLSDGRHTASAPVRVDSYSRSLSDMITTILSDIGNDGCAVIGFDFPIGLPLICSVN